MKRVIFLILVYMFFINVNNVYSVDIEYIDGYTPGQYLKSPRNVLLVSKINYMDVNSGPVLLEVRDFKKSDCNYAEPIYYYCFDGYVMYERRVINGGSLTQLFWQNEYGVAGLVSCKRYIEQNGRNNKSKF